MSYDGTADKDLELKLRVMNLLWNQGWFVRPNVKLYRYQEGKRTNEQYTDIDVYGIRLFALQNPIISVCSAKSGKESDAHQVFWLSGVKSYFGASLAFYVRTKANLVMAKGLCQKLDIIPMNDEQLRSLEQRFGIDATSKSSNFTSGIFLQMSYYFDEIKEKKAGIYNYIADRYWIEPLSNQLLRVITALRDLSGLNVSDDCKLFMKYYMASLLALPVFRFAHSLISVPTNNLRTELQTEIMGGEHERREREKIFAAVKSFLSELAKKNKLSSEIVETGFDFERSIVDLAGDLYDIVLALVEHYNHAAFVPRMIDALMYQVARKKGTVPRVEEVTLPEISQSEWKHVSKLTNDFLLFLVRIGVLERRDINI